MLSKPQCTVPSHTIKGNVYNSIVVGLGKDGVITPLYEGMQENIGQLITANSVL